MAYKILAIDDDPSILRLIKNVLSLSGYEVTTREEIDDINLCDFIGYDLILLDIMMPVNGLDICEHIRSEVKAPILFITAKDMDDDLVKGVQAGADDYITKPFSVQELQARVKMHLRREERHQSGEKTLQFGDILIDVDNQGILVKDDVLPFTKREFVIIHLLAGNSNRTFSIEEIYERVYPLSSNTQIRSIAEYIYQIRSKFKPYCVNPIKTMWGAGYKWEKDEVSNN